MGWTDAKVYSGSWKGHDLPAEVVTRTEIDEQKPVTLELMTVIIVFLSMRVEALEGQGFPFTRRLLCTWWLLLNQDQIV